MHRSTRLMLRAILASTALGATALGAGAAQAAVYTTADAVGKAAAAQRVTFNVFLPLRDKDGLSALLQRLQDPASGQYHKWLTPAQFGAQFGPTAATMKAARDELVAKGFTVSARTRSLTVVGTAGQVQAAFQAPLSTVAAEEPGRTRLVALSGLKMTPALAAAGAMIPEFSAHKPVAHTASQMVSSKPVPDNRYGPNRLEYWYDDLRQAYSYPAVNAMVTDHTGATQALNGSGVSIGALMSSDMLDSDVALLFAHEMYSTTTGKPAPVPAGHIYVQDAVPGTFTGAFGEASLDIQQEIGGAPGASVYLYDILDLYDSSIIGGYLEIDERNVLDVASSSFGGCELAYTAAYNNGTSYLPTLVLESELYQQGNAQGITFLASSGDEAGRVCPSVNYVNGTASAGSGPNEATFIPSVGTPAADPNVTGVGGTNLVTSSIPSTQYPPYAYSLDAIYKDENSYSDPEVAYDPYGLGLPVFGGFWGAGGGVSTIYPKPDYQSALVPGVTKRLEPDVGMMVGGCPFGLAKLPCDGGDRPVNGNGNSQRSFSVIYIDGGLAGLIGTSVASPEFASAVALMVELHGRQGNLNPYLYALAAKQKLSTPDKSFHRGIPGFNGVVRNSVPDKNLYNYMVGLGTPIVVNMIGAPAGTPTAGTPRTPSNP